MSSHLRTRAAVAVAALAGSLLAACGANGEGAPAEPGCPVNATTTCQSSESTTTSSTSSVNPCASPTPAPQGADDFCARVAVTNSLPDGLQYGDIVVGTGPAVKSGDKINVQYTGWLESNGVMFDTSRQPGRGAFSLTLGQNSVIAGWEEGIPGMKVGGKRRLVIPPALGYGAQGQPPTIPGNAVLVFDVQVVSLG
jgi:peptidylprolyl isomerase